MDPYFEKYLKYKNKYINAKEKMIGGVGDAGILGKGAAGEVHTLESFLSSVNDNDTINIYTGEKVTQVNTNSFILWMKNMNTDESKIIKKFLKKDKFMAEMFENQKVIEIYKSKPNLITLENNNFNGTVPVHGVSINSYYITFGKKCDPQYKITEVNLTGVIENLLESIKVINDAGYYHNDIKPSNIIECSDGFKLIDWGASNYVTEEDAKACEQVQPKNIMGKTDACRKRGDPVFSSPVKLYFTFGTAMKDNIPKTTLDLELLKHKPDWDYIDPGKIITLESKDKSKQTKLTAIKKILDDQNIIFKKILNTSNQKTLYKTYYKSFDVYMLGMTILHLIYKFDLEDNVYTKYKDLILSFISLKSPLDIDGAINKFDELFRVIKK
jgi:serine/threonine protein kinase